MLASGGASGQSLGDPVVPAGRLRLRMDPVYTQWDSRFGMRTEGGTTTEEEEPLGRDLTDPTGTSLFPGVSVLEESLRALTGNPAYAANLGSTRGMISHLVTRVDFGADLGVFDWLTVGFTVPWLRTETTVEAVFRADSATADLGVSPALAEGSSESLLFFLQGVQDAATAAQLDADSKCASAPTSPECAAAQSLSDRASAMFAGLDLAYFVSPFFPRASSAVAAELTASVDALSADLAAAGLPGITSPVPYAGGPLTQADFDSLAADGAYGIGGAPLGHLRSLWGYGDVEITAAARLLERLPSPQRPNPSVTYRLSARALLRLPTGKRENPDVFLDLGWGDGQTDVEGLLHGMLTAGRLGLEGSVRYGKQGGATIVRRVARPEVVMPPLATRTQVRWSPGDYMGVRVSPRLRLTDALSIALEYRLFDRGADRFQLVAEPLPGSPPLDPAELEAETSITLHQAAVGLSYSTRLPWSAGAAPTPVELDARVVRAVAGSGGQAPVWTRLELGLHVFRRMWGRNPGSTR